jgi:hypothetical protein
MSNNDYRLGNCMLCHSAPVEVRHINLYIIGSEGLYACHSCEMQVVEFARNLMLENGRRKLKASQQRRAADAASLSSAETLGDNSRRG